MPRPKSIDRIPMMFAVTGVRHGRGTDIEIESLAYAERMTEEEASRLASWSDSLSSGRWGMGVE